MSTGQLQTPEAHTRNLQHRQFNQTSSLKIPNLLNPKPHNPKPHIPSPDPLNLGLEVSMVAPAQKRAELEEG